MPEATPSTSNGEITSEAASINDLDGMPEATPSTSNGEITSEAASISDLDRTESIDSQIARTTGLLTKYKFALRLEYLWIAASVIATSFAILWYAGALPRAVAVLLPSPQNDPNNTFIPVFLGSLGSLFFSIFVSITTGLTLVDTKTKIDVLNAKKYVSNQFAGVSEKTAAPYFDKLVQINVQNLSEYYELVKAHTNKSFNVSIVAGILGFSLVLTGLALGFIQIPNTQTQTISYIATASGVITEFIAGVFFYLYNRTVRQMKGYHDSLLSVQNILLSFKIVEDTRDEGEKAKMVGQMIAYLVGKQGSQIGADGMYSGSGQSTVNGKK